MNPLLRKILYPSLPIVAWLVGHSVRSDRTETPPPPSTTSAVQLAPIPSLVTALESRSSEGYRRLMANGRINHNQRLGEWALVDPPGCYAWIMEQKRWQEIDISTGSMFTGPDPLLSSLYFAWADRDPRAALEAIGKAKLYANMGQFGILWHLLQKDPMATIALFHEYPKDRGGVSRSGPSWVRGDLPVLTRAVAELPKKWKDILLPDALAAWGKADPAAALAWLQGETDPPRDAFNHLISGWAQKDSAAALSYLRQASAQEQQQGARAVVEAIGKHDPNQAWQIAQELQSVEGAGTNLLYQWKQANAKAAVSAVAALDDPQLRERIYKHFGASTSWNPTDAATWCAAMNLGERQNFMVEVVKVWSRDKMGAVTAYLNAAPAEMITPELMDASVQHFSSDNRFAKNNAEAVAWALELPAEYHSQAIASIFHQLPWFIESKELQASVQAVADPTLREIAIKSLHPDTTVRLPKAK